MLTGEPYSAATTLAEKANLEVLHKVVHHRCNNVEAIQPTGQLANTAVSAGDITACKGRAPLSVWHMTSIHHDRQH